MSNRYKKINYSEIYWRGSISDLATDCAYLFDKETMEEFITELQKIQEKHTDKLCDKGWI